MAVSIKNAYTLGQDSGQYLGMSQANLTYIAAAGAGVMILLALIKRKRKRKRAGRAATARRTTPAKFSISYAG